jgi:hypothetical protein
MILDGLEVPRAELEARTGWQIRPEGACKADRCVPLPDADGGERIDVQVLAERLDMALVQDEKHGLWALGPESGGHVLPSAELPDLTLTDRDGKPFSVRSLRGTKVLLVAWASW